MRHYPSRDQRQAERQAITGIAVGPFGNQQIIANKQARLHGFRGDVEGRDNKTAQDENEEAKLHEEKQEIPRSEEHTSELQSLMRTSYAVFCLTKKKKYKNIQQKHYNQSNTDKYNN